MASPKVHGQSTVPVLLHCTALGRGGRLMVGELGPTIAKGGLRQLAEPRAACRGGNKKKKLLHVGIVSAIGWWDELNVSRYGGV
ncbi:uncharacterized protein GLRG_03260 [Colletotrichum graminicola M1.001]|uniref:Uncharacterized protein n=1 Tax=Colletotrichum graminicola (strain M1.001 / M2 / FGSC 10212) TaxID=645133 RepID=E3QB78_COLGM|nr:uncharacterized protein GLRG_03260 [Colletotrichum graminicola M1.001]EFQ28116.1 hypothetical protein GLRG_03260 [Colletotrichum graminicola M1.001]